MSKEQCGAAIHDSVTVTRSST